MHYRIVHLVPDPRMHGLYGYAEVIETMRWGLTELGHQVSVTQNNFSTEPGHTNILFGAQMLRDEHLQRFPHGTIVYNLEQIARLPIEGIKPALRYAAEKFVIWDYIDANIEVWRRLSNRCTPRIVPIGWSPTLRRIERRSVEDIDVLFYGVPDSTRNAIFTALCVAGLKCILACGFYGSARDELIARAKIILNLNRQASRIFEIVRVSYLLANAKAVVSDVYPDSIIEPDIQQAVELAPPDEIVQTCAELLADDEERTLLAEEGRQIMERRDIREYLRAALAG